MDSETIKLLVTTCGAPAIIALLASGAGAVWYIVKIRAIGNEKRTEQGYNYTLAKEASVRAYGEGVSTREAQQLNEITSAALKQIYGLTDGTLTRIADNIKQGNIEQAVQDARILSEMAGQFAVVIASLNKTIEQQARILSALLDLLSHSSSADMMAGLTKDILSGLTTATITSQPVQNAQGVADAAMSPTGNEPADGTAKIIVEGEQVK